MVKQSSLRVLAFMLAAAGVLVSGSRADAALVMTIDDGVNPLITITDNDGIFDTNDDIGIITFAEATNGIATNSITGFGVQGGSAAILDVASLHSSFPGGPGGSLTIMLSQTDFVLPPVGSAILSSAVGGTTSGAGTLSSSVLLDTTNSLPYAVGPTTSLGPMSGMFFGGTTSTSFVYNGGPFSMTRVIEITIGAGETMSYNSFAEVSVPEPATMAYLGLSLGALALRRRRRSAA